MILVQKPHTLTHSHSPLHAHRRHPSAPPTVVVLPTRTPGLLTLSKPPRPPLQRQNQRQTLKPLPSTPPVRPPLPNPPAKITDNKKSGVIATPPPQPRGRGQVKHAKDRVQNQSPGRGKHGRQHSPLQLQQIPSQVEATVISSINSIDSLDPFLDNDSSLSSNPSSPTVPSQISVNCKQHTPSPSLVHVEAIPVPVVTRRQTPNISRSNPLPSHIRQRPRPISALPSTFQHSPIYDDMNDVAHLGAPTTPPPTRRHDNGLQTAPISSRTPGAFPFNTGLPSSPASLASRKGNRKHRRTPSEGVFHMSSDEDPSSGPGETFLNPNVQALFGLVNTFKPSSKVSPSAFSTPIRAIPPFKRNSASPTYLSLSNEKLSEREDAEKAAGYFASSMFQNSPSPEELPDPLLF